MRKATLAEIIDPNSDLHIERYAEEAQQSTAMVIRAIDRAASPFLVGAMARRAARAGVKALEIIERRGSDDLEAFCAAPLPAAAPTPPNPKARPLGPAKD
jgi:hypothetical protein